MLLVPVLLCVLLLPSVYVQVHEGEAVAIARLGRIDRVLRDAGPALKWPWPVEETIRVDLRRRLWQSPLTATFTRDQKNLLVSAFVIWRVDQPERFLSAAGTPEDVERWLAGRTAAELQVHLRDDDLAALLKPTALGEPTGDRSPTKLQKIEEEVLRGLQADAQSKLGLEIQRVGLNRLAYPAENVKEVLAQMQAARQAEAATLRATGEKEAQRIRDEGQVQSAALVQAGQLEAGRIAAQAERDAAQVIAQAQQLDPAFYEFWRTLEALRETLGTRTTILLRSDPALGPLLSPSPTRPGTE